MNVQVLTDPFGRLLWASPALPGSTHDLTAARQHGIIDALTDAGLGCWADKAYQGAGGPVRVPFRGRRLTRWKRRYNTTHAKIRCRGEQAVAGSPCRDQPRRRGNGPCHMIRGRVSSFPLRTSAAAKIRAGKHADARSRRDATRTPNMLFPHSFLYGLNQVLRLG
ncbi:hypothetical protein GCM10010431_86170 [Streptomyces kunmingensis]